MYEEGFMFILMSYKVMVIGIHRHFQLYLDYQMGAGQ